MAVNRVVCFSGIFAVFPLSQALGSMQSAQFALHADIEQRHWWFVARRRIMRQVIGRVLSPDPESVVVDVGCGTGANIASLAEEYRCIGIDTSREGVGWARKRFSGVEFLCGQAPEDLGPLAQQAKLFLLMDVLEHVPDDFEMLSSLLAAASPGACFLVTVPAGMHLWTEHDESFGHYRRYTRQRLERIWADLPVETLLLSHYNSRLYPVVRAVRGWNRLRGRAGGASGTDFAVPPQLANEALTRIFAGEGRRLVGLLDGNLQRPYGRGVSLMALVRRKKGRVQVRRKPRDLTRDYYDPARGETANPASLNA